MVSLPQTAAAQERKDAVQAEKNSQFKARKAAERAAAKEAEPKPVKHQGAFHVIVTPSK